MRRSSRTYSNDCAPLVPTKSRRASRYPIVSGRRQGMVLTISWPDQRGKELPSPFLRGAGERRLRLTFHDSTLAAPPAGEAFALDVLRDLAHLPLVDAYGTEDGEFPHLVIATLPDELDMVAVDVWHQSECRG